MIHCRNIKRVILKIVRSIVVCFNFSEKSYQISQLSIESQSVSLLPYREGVPGFASIGRKIMRGNKINKLEDNGRLIATTQIERSAKTVFLNCAKMRNGRLLSLGENPMLFIRNTLDLIK
ncbi:Nuclear pore membrane glycoprotein -like protein [Dirofilaria immitis]